MTTQEIQRINQKQQSFFDTGKTLDIKYRIEALKRLKAAIVNNRANIEKALQADLGKSAFESYMCEVGLTLSEISYMIKHIKKFSKDKRVTTGFANFPAKSFIKSSPYGRVLIMSPWNYPFMLTLEPLCDALSAGNCAVVKPSAYSPETTKVIEKVIKEAFDEEYVAVVTGGRQENEGLLREKYDCIFFTGSESVGKIVMESAAKHLTPVVLELGGKSPCIVEKDAKIELAAKRIVFGKYLNCGQTCVAPDYILCHSSIKDKLLEAIKNEITLQYGENALENKDYGKIINQKHFERLCGLIDKNKVYCGGKADEKTCRIQPCVMDNVTYEDAVMQEEIFGPVLPVLTFEEIDEVVANVNSGAKPLALYLFTQSKTVQQKVMTMCQFGGGCINDTIMHLTTPHMPFGGVGQSGMGGYHGKFGFDAFSHKKSIVDKKTFVDIPMRYAPYKKSNLKMLEFVIK